MSKMNNTALVECPYYRKLSSGIKRHQTIRVFSMKSLHIHLVMLTRLEKWDDPITWEDGVVWEVAGVFPRANQAIEAAVDLSRSILAQYAEEDKANEVS